MFTKKIPKIQTPEPTKRYDTPNKCKTCAYHTPSSSEEDEMTYWYYAEDPRPHPCHERQQGFACKGSMEQFERLGLKYEM